MTDHQILITGYKGLLGSSFKKALASKGYQYIELEYSQSNLEYIPLSTLDFSKVTYLFHIGAYSKRDADWDIYFKKNIEPLGAIYRLSSLFNKFRIIFISAASCTPSLSSKIICADDDQNFPTDMYSYSKLIGEHILSTYSVRSELVVLRVPGIYHEAGGSGFLYGIIQKAIKNQSIQISNPFSLTNAGITLPTLVNFLCGLVNEDVFNNIRGKIVYLGANKSVSFFELVKFILSQLKSTSFLVGGLENTVAIKNYILNTELALESGLECYSMYDVANIMLPQEGNLSANN